MTIDASKTPGTQGTKPAEDHGANEAVPESQTPTPDVPDTVRGRRAPVYRAPELVEVLIGSDWRRASYRSHNDQYDIHSAVFPDGTTWQGGSDEIRLIE